MKLEIKAYNVINEIKANLTKDVCYIESITDIKEDIIEFIAERDEELLEMYLTENIIIGYGLIN